MKKILLNTVAIALLIAFAASGCVEHRYYSQYHHHSPEYDHRHHHDDGVGVGVDIHN
jgi:hypothetical protein